MAGMVTRLTCRRTILNVPGLSVNFSGDGFATMRFNVDAVPVESFAQWVMRRATPVPARRKAYADLAAQQRCTAFIYRAVVRTVRRHLERSHAHDRASRPGPAA
jgi:cytochrome o ubiquinol oxidase subunit 2